MLKKLKEHDKTFEGLMNSIPEYLRDMMHDKYKKLREKQLNSLIEAIIEWSSKGSKKMNKRDLNKILKNISNYLDNINYYQVNYSRYQVCNNFIDYLSDNNMLTDEEFLMIKILLRMKKNNHFQLMKLYL